MDRIPLGGEDFRGGSFFGILPGAPENAHRGRRFRHGSPWAARTSAIQDPRRAPAPDVLEGISLGGQELRDGYHDPAWT